MNVKLRKIEVDVETADLLEARAAALGMSVSALLAELAGNESMLPPDLAELRGKSEGPWSSEAIAEDERRLAEFDVAGAFRRVVDGMHAAGVGGGLIEAAQPECESGGRPHGYEAVELAGIAKRPRGAAEQHRGDRHQGPSRPPRAPCQPAQQEGQ